METSVTLAPGTQIEGRYVLQDFLGEGSFGEVWKAVDLRLGARFVAVKCLKAEMLDRPEVVARFDNEAAALMHITHPHVVTVVDRGVWNNQRFIVMEYVEGHALSAWIDEHRSRGVPTDLPTVQLIFDQICSGVGAAHAVRVPGPIVHRDMKPDNVILGRQATGELHAKVLDFGIAQLGARRGTNDRLAARDAGVHVPRTRHRAELGDQPGDGRLRARGGPGRNAHGLAPRGRSALVVALAQERARPARCAREPSGGRPLGGVGRSLPGPAH